MMQDVHGEAKGNVLPEAVGVMQDKAGFLTESAQNHCLIVISFGNGAEYSYGDCRDDEGSKD